MTGITNAAQLFVIAEHESAVEFAAEELKRYASRMLCAPQKGDACKIYLGCSEAFCEEYGGGDLRYDGYKIAPADGGWAFVSKLPRGVLFAVYDFLAANGCVFAKAAGVAESVPARETLVFFEKTEIPDMEIRGLTIGVSEINEKWARETTEIVDWAAKNRLNMFFLHESLSASFAGANEKVAKEILRRGMNLEFGGHGIQDSVPRELFPTHPEYFIEKGGARTASGNFCVSSGQALEFAAQKLLSLLRDSPHIDVLHVWFEDTVGGSWCECEKCGDKAPVQQMNLAISYLADAVREEFPDLKLDLLLYHDTIAHVGALDRVRENVIVEFAARERCYAHPIDAPDCGLNRAYLQKLDECIKKFGAENVEVFEYYMDFILFSKVKTVLAHTIAQDLRCYHGRGLRKITPLNFGLYSFWAYDVNLYVYAAHTFHTDLNVEETLAEYRRRMGLPQEYLDYIERMEQFTRQYFAFCGYENCYDDIRGLPLCPYFEEHLAKIGRGIEYLKQAAALLQEMRQKAKGAAKDYLLWEEKLLKISEAECEGLYLRMKTRLQNYKSAGKNKAELLRELEKVKSGLYGILDIIRQIPPEIKGVQGGNLFEEHLCKDQIWTVNELLCKEFDEKVSLDRSGI